MPTRPSIGLACLAMLTILALGACHRAAARHADAPLRRAVYVEDAARLMSDGDARAELRRLAVSGWVTDVVPYGLGSVLADAGGRAQVAAWFAELADADVRVVVPIAGLDRLEALDVLVLEHAVRIDALVTELEFWNRPDRAAALDELLELIAAMRAHAGAWERDGAVVACGAYLGYPTTDEAERIAQAIDFAFLDYGVTSAATAWSHVHARHGSLRDRFAVLVGAGVAVWPIFYATGEVDMHDELARNGAERAETVFQSDLAADAELGAYHVDGFVYFTFEAMPRR